MAISTTTSTSPAGRGTTRLGGLIAKIVGLGLAAGIAVALTPALVGTGSWGFLAVVWLITAALFATYATRRALPAKYLLPGSLFLVMLVVVPVLLTVQTSTTNLGDGTRGTKQDTIASIIGSSVVQTPDAPRYNLSVATGIMIYAATA